MVPRDLPKLKTVTILAPVVYVVVAEIFRDSFLIGALSRYQVTVVVTLSTLVGAYVFSELVFRLIARMQCMLDRERQRIERIFLHTSNAIILIDEAGRVVTMNPVACRLTGNTEEAVRNGEVRFDRIFADSGPDGVPLWWREVQERGQLPNFEATVAGPDGGIPVTGSAAAIPAPEGGTQVALIMRDVRVVKSLESEVERRRLQAGGLYDIGLELASLGELEENLKSVLRKIKDILRADLVGWAFANEGMGDLDWRILEVDAGERPPESSMDVPEALAREALASGRPAIRAHPCCALAAVPVLLRGRPVGVLLVGSWFSPRLTDADILFLSSVATQAAVALENHELYKRGQGQAILEERERLAKEMHDGFGQTLTYLSAMVATMEQLLHKGKAGEALAKLAETREMLTQAHQEVRTAIFNLRQRPSEGDFVSQVGKALYQLGRQGGMETELKTDGQGRIKLPFEAEVQILRVVQEALANIRKHSGATRAVVHITQHDGVLEVTVTDNGRGFRLDHTPELGQHFGLRIMQERSQAVGGTLEIESAPGRGTRVRLMVPLRRWKQPA